MRAGALLALTLFFGCEPLRPVVEAPAATGPSRQLSRARDTHSSGGDLRLVLEQLDSALKAPASEQDLEAARRLRLQLIVEWYQLARIGAQALGHLAGADRVMTGLGRYLKGQRRQPVPPEPKARKLELLFGLASGGDRVDSSAVKRELIPLLEEAMRSADPHTRDFARTCQRFVAAESTWRYGTRWPGDARRMRDMLSHLEDDVAVPLHDNVWLTLKVSTSLALRAPAIPRRGVLQAVAALVDVELDPTQSPEGQLVALGRGAGDTEPERLWASWRNLRARVSTALEALKAAPKESDGRRTWRLITDHLRLEAPGARPDPADLVAIAEPDRAGIVQRWTETLHLRVPSDRSAMRAIEVQLRKTWNNPDVIKRGRTPAVLALATLVTAQAVALVLEVKGRAVRLSEAGPFERRALVAPGGVVRNAWPAAVGECLKIKDRDCLWGLVTGMAQQKKERD